MHGISNWEELFYIFEKEGKGKKTLLIPSSRSIHTMLLMHIHSYVNEGSAVYNNGVTLNSSSYCQLSDSEDECAMIAVYSHSIFDVYPAALLLSLCVISLEFMHHFQYELQLSIAETSWTLPLPFCSGHHESDIVEDFVYKVRAMHTLYNIEYYASQYTFVKSRLSYVHGIQ